MSDSAIALSYLAISGLLGYLVWKARKDLPLRWLFACFGVFIVACGTTHFMEVLTLWVPVYWTAGGVKVVTAIASLATAALLPSSLPVILRMIEIAKFSEAYRGQLEEALSGSERKICVLMDSAGEGILGVDRAGKLTFVNQAARQMLGHKEDLLLGGDIHTFIHHHRKDGQQFSAEECPILRTLSNGQQHNIDADVFWREDDKAIDVAYAVAPIFRENLVDGAVVVFRDVSERNRLTEELIRSQRVEAIGRLAAGVAHDFNNSLGIILGNAELLKAKVLSDSSLTVRCDAILQASKQAATLTKQLLAFSRKQVLSFQPLSVNELITNMEAMVRRTLPENVHFSLRLATRIGTVKADTGQLQQVLLNLVLNARDALPDGGKIILETSNVVLDETYAQKHIDVKPGTYVLLSVGDNGIGMEDSVKEHVFEPFFTTKPSGKGTGLGLASVYGIIRQSGGYISVYSELGKGTTFKIYLPRVDEEAVLTRLEGINWSAMRGSETILVVEDQPQLLDLIKEILSGSGYQVVAAHDGQAAISLARELRSLELLITDMVMPGMGPDELRRQISFLFPKSRVLFISGYSSEFVSKLGGDVEELLQKPFSPGELVSTVRQILDR